MESIALWFEVLLTIGSLSCSSFSTVNNNCAAHVVQYKFSIEWDPFLPHSFVQIHTKRKWIDHVNRIDFLYFHHMRIVRDFIYFSTSSKYHFSLARSPSPCFSFSLTLHTPWSLGVANLRWNFMCPKWFCFVLSWFHLHATINQQAFNLPQCSIRYSTDKIN